jgi:hypothetical protein
MADATTNADVPITRDRARFWARLLHEQWGFTDIEIVEQWKTGAVRLTGTNRAGRRRSISTLAEFEAIKKFEA